jgi:tetratricopeptide (TPR) repeat protein
MSLSHATDLPDPSARIAALNNLALACRRANEIERAIALTQDALALCAAQGDRHREAALHNNLADLLHAAGRRDEAMRQLRRAVATFADISGSATEPEVWKLVEW